MKKILTIGLLAFVSPGVALRAQNTEHGVGDFMVERVLTLTSVVAPTPPSFPDAVLAGLQNGVIEIHQRFTYNSAQRLLDQLAFVVPANSPVPFPDPSSAPVGDHYIIQVESASIASQPAPSVILAGHAIQNDVPTPWGNVSGAGVTLTFAYTAAGASVKFGAILESVSPLYGLYSASGAGALSLEPSLQKCSLSVLNGVYMYTQGGSIQTSTGFIPWAESGNFTADGNGNMTVVHSGNQGGQAYTNKSFPATYVVNEDCSGAISFSGSSIDFRLSKDGKTVDMSWTQPTAVIANGSARLQ